MIYCEKIHIKTRKNIEKHGFFSNLVQLFLKSRATLHKRGTTITVDTMQLHYSELKLLGVFHQTPDDYRRSLKLLATRLVDGRDFVKETVPLSQLLNTFKRVKALEGIKFAIDPTVL
ncbi:MAG: hypothetical protein AB1798_20190 [Spirochaetota bacterium]